MSKRTAKLLIYIVTAICVLGIAMHRQSSTRQADNEPGSFTQLEGTVFHTVYHIQYEGSADYHDDIKRLFREFDGSLSMFNDTSIITRINRCDTSVIVNDYCNQILPGVCGGNVAANELLKLLQRVIDLHEAGFVPRLYQQDLYPLHAFPSCIAFHRIKGSFSIIPASANASSWPQRPQRMVRKPQRRQPRYKPSKPQPWMNS